jgi:hypothetical protein
MIKTIYSTQYTHDQGQSKPSTADHALFHIPVAISGAQSSEKSQI